MIAARSERLPSRSGSHRKDCTLSIVQRLPSASSIPSTCFGNMLCANIAWTAYSPTNR